jgi:hypothetical protein
MREKSPDASFFDVQAMMEKPFDNLDAVSSVFGRLKQQTGGGELYKQALYSMFEKQLSRTDIGEILKSGGDFQQIATKAKLAESEQAAKGTKGYEGRASQVVGTLDQATAKIDSYTQSLGKDMVEYMDKSFAVIQDTLKNVFGDDGKSIQDAAKKGVMQGILESFATRGAWRGP